MRTIGKKVVFHLLILCRIVTLLFPIYIMLTGAFKSAAELATNATGLPQSFSFVNFDRLLRYNSGIMVRTYLNSIFVTVVYTVLVLFLASLAAFAFSKYRFRGKNVLFFCLLATMMIPTELTIAPLYIVFSRIHWLDTYIVQIIPGVGNVFAMFLFKQYMDGIPSALVEAARIDGCGHFRTYLKIMLPITKPIIGALTILVGLGKWNDSPLADDDDQQNGNPPHHGGPSVSQRRGQCAEHPLGARACRLHPCFAAACYHFLCVPESVYAERHHRGGQGVTGPFSGRKKR